MSDDLTIEQVCRMICKAYGVEPAMRVTESAIDALARELCEQAGIAPIALEIQPDGSPHKVIEQWRQFLPMAIDQYYKLP